MYVAYTALAVAFFVVMSPYLLYQAVRYRKVHHEPETAHGLSAGVVQP